MAEPQVADRLWIVAVAALTLLASVALVATVACPTGAAAAAAPTPAPPATGPGLRLLGSQRVGLEDPRSLVASPDGRSLYAVSPDADAALSFRTRPLRFQGCFSANQSLGPQPEPRRGGERRPPARPSCKSLPGAGSEDAVSGFNGVRFATVSPDGRSVYTVSDDDSIGIFARKPDSGRLNYRGCVTGATGPNTAGKRRVCRTVPAATPVHRGIFSGLGGPASLTVSPDGRFAYAAARSDAAIAIFARQPNGLLTFTSCLTGGISATVPGFSSACTRAAYTNTHASGLHSVSRIAISPDGTSLYASGPRVSSVAEFERNPVDGLLTYRGCLTGESRGLEPSNPCRPIPTAREAGAGSGLWLLDDLAVSPDGRFLYGAAKGDDAIAAFRRDPATGTLAYIESEPALDQPRDLLLSPSGRSVYVAASGDSAVVRLRRDPSSGALSFGAAQRGIGGVDSLAIAGRTLYAAAARRAEIARFAIAGG